MELTLDQALQQAITAHKEGKLQDAERLYRAILQANPEHPDTNHNLGVLVVALGKPIEALPLFQQALDGNPQIEQFWLSYVDTLIRLQRFDEANRILVEGEKAGLSSDKLDILKPRLRGGATIGTDKAAKNLTLSEKRKKHAERNKKKKSRKIEARSSSPRAEPSQEHIDRLLVHYQASRLEEAEELATLLTQQFPKHPFGWKALGAIFQQAGRLRESLLPMQKSVGLSPNDAEARYNLGNILKELGRLDEAITSYGQAIALKPDYAEAHNNLGNTLKELGRLDDAEASYVQATGLRPGYALAHKNLGNTLGDLGRLDEAEASYRKAIALKPNYAEAHCNLGNTLEGLDRLDEAETSYREAIVLKPAYAEAHSNLGVVLTQLGRLDEAEASYRDAIALRADFAQAHNNLGNTLKELGRLDEAEASYGQAIALNPDYAEAHNNLGNTLKELGRLSEAEVSLRQAVELKFDYADAHHNLGNTLKELGKLDEAAASYRKAVALEPENLSAKHHIAALSGATTACAPLEYVEDLFDYFAPKFEKSMVGDLEYHLPKAIAEVILRDCGHKSLGSVIDLGCGTGLVGAEIKAFCGYLEGVDLSQKMLNQAKEKKVYNELIKQDILTHLATTDLNFEYFIAADVFIYVGDLTEVFRLIKSRNRKHGKLVFSTENYDGVDFFLEESGRYSHSKQYVQSLCQKLGYVLRDFQTQNLRKEKNHYVSGAIYMVEF